ncbi:class I SAM-dependent methyltransferase [Phenylobacterium sp.]|jgi:SAM-dependent methyltransferase|uniref:class I SAM-dependent methyltransferase n=1 Tax=Phenylobacterium sp. TaxID=1871053 RepID=UPI002F4300E9
MGSLADFLGRKRPPPPWAQSLFQAPLTPHLRDGAGRTLVWTVEDLSSKATITDQFKANAAEYHQRYSASDHFEGLFRSALAATGIEVAAAPLILDLGSGSGVNSVVPCQRLFENARIVATDLSGELLAMLGAYVQDQPDPEAVVGVKMDAMSAIVTPGAFDVVTGASILHHLLDPRLGLAAAARALRPGGHAIFFEPFDGWGLLRYAYRRILAESALRDDPLDAGIVSALEAMIHDVATRSAPDTAAPWFADLDDKWLFSRTRIEAWATNAGFSDVRFVPHLDHATMYRDTAAVQLRLMTGRADLALPDWALVALDDLDAAMTYDARRQLMLEGSIVLTR